MHSGLKALVLCALALTLALGGCGRRGALDVPASSAVSPDPATTAQTGNQPVDATAEPADSKSFPLDFLIK